MGKRPPWSVPGSPTDPQGAGRSPCSHPYGRPGCLSDVEMQGSPDDAALSFPKRSSAISRRTGVAAGMVIEQPPIWLTAASPRAARPCIRVDASDWQARVDLCEAAIGRHRRRPICATRRPFRVEHRPTSLDAYVRGDRRRRWEERRKRTSTPRWTGSISPGSCPKPAKRLGAW